jgi:hypothetical protein
MIFIGFDISTSVIGVTILNSNDDKFDPKNNFLYWEAIELNKFKDFWDKVDFVKFRLSEIKKKYPVINYVFVEEPLKKFMPGSSSAHTISTLQRMNGIVSYIAYDFYQIRPTYISFTTARKLCGIKTIQKSKDPLKRSLKEQAFYYIINGELSYISWPTKKNGKFKDSCKDIIDAYIITKSGILLNIK